MSKEISYVEKFRDYKVNPEDIRIYNYVRCK